MEEKKELRVISIYLQKDRTVRIEVLQDLLKDNTGKEIALCCLYGAIEQINKEDDDGEEREVYA